jgi:hypothetical protein
MARMNILPEPAFLDLKPVLSTRLAQVGASVHAEQFGALLDPLIRGALEQGFTQAGAHEGTVWLVDETIEYLVPAYNSGMQAERLVGKFKQPLNAGLVCMVFASEQPFLENEVWKNARQSKKLDALLRVQTCAMIAVPFYLLQACRGVVSCVQLRTPACPDPRGFGPEHLASVQRATALVSRLLEYRLLSSTVGWTSE